MSLENFNLSSVSVFLFLSIINCVASLLGSVGDISVVSLSVVSDDGPWFEGVSLIVVWPVIDLIFSCVPRLLFFPVFGLMVLAIGVDWNLACPHLMIKLGNDCVINFIINHLDVSELVLFSFYVVVVSEFFVLNPLSNSARTCFPHRVLR